MLRLSALALLALILAGASFALTMQAGDTAAVTCPTVLELVGHELRCATESATLTAPASSTPTATATATPSPTATQTASPTASPSATAAPSATPTHTATATASPFPSATSTSPSLSVALIGDSNSDEYRANDARGGTYGATTFNWAELLARLRGMTLGPWGTRSEPRRTGYEFLWARSGAVAYNARFDQAPGAASQVQAGRVQAVIVWVGGNDFRPLGTLSYQRIYDGSLAGSQLDGAITWVVDQVLGAAQTAAAGVPSRVMVVGMQQGFSGPARVFNSADLAAMGMPDPAKLARVTNAVYAFNAQLSARAQAAGYHWFDLDGATAAELTPRRTADGSLLVGGQVIDYLSHGDEPHHLLLADTHYGTAMSGLVANLFARALNAQFGAGLAEFSDAEILAAAGMH